MMKNNVLKKSTIFCLIVTIVFSANTIAFADSVETASMGEKVVVLSEFIEGGDAINGAPAGVTFGGEVTASGSYALTGAGAAAAASAIGIAVGVEGTAAYILLCVTTAISLGASCIYWEKRIAYGEDSNYYYTRTKLRLYIDSAHNHPLGAWKIVYNKKSKNSGASTGEDEI